MKYTQPHVVAVVEAGTAIKALDKREDLTDNFSQPSGHSVPAYEADE